MLFFMANPSPRVFQSIQAGCCQPELIAYKTFCSVVGEVSLIAVRPKRARKKIGLDSFSSQSFKKPFALRHGNSVVHASLTDKKWAVILTDEV